MEIAEIVLKMLNFCVLNFGLYWHAWQLSRFYIMPVKACEIRTRWEPSVKRYTIQSLDGTISTEN